MTGLASFLLSALLSASGGPGPLPDGGGPAGPQGGSRRIVNATADERDPDWLPRDQRRLNTAEIRDLITGSSVTYETARLGNRPMVEKFHSNGTSEKFGPRAVIRARYEIANDELCIHFQHAAAEGQHECRRLFMNKDGQMSMWFLASDSKELYPIIVKPLD